MLWIDPERVTLETESELIELDGVELIAADRRAGRLVVEYTDRGPHAGFADVTEQRTSVRIVRRPDETAPPGLGTAATLRFRTARASGDAGGALVSIVVVVAGVEHQFDVRRGGRQVLTCIAVSEDGALDPVTIEREDA
ncbi:MAG: hypothetical protein EA376_00135 [Phycisphaeraceae bacterium]|nr:MAG: hypothetical protein EA376_00135 [Phycisphaeraceae bacterium]